MTQGRLRTAWLLMTDSIGLTGPGKKPELPSPRSLLVQVIVWIVLTVAWGGMVFRTQGGAQALYVFLVLMAAAMTVFQLVRLRRSRRAGGSGRRSELH